MINPKCKGEKCKHHVPKRTCMGEDCSDMGNLKVLETDKETNKNELSTFNTNREGMLKKSVQKKNTKSITN